MELPFNDKIQQQLKELIREFDELTVPQHPILLTDSTTGRIATVMTQYSPAITKVFGLTDNECTELINHNQALDEFSKAEKIDGALAIKITNTRNSLLSKSICVRGHKYVNFIIAQFGYKLKCFAPATKYNNAFWTLEK